MKIKCTKCGDVLEGDKKGTWITCTCKAIYIDETKWYYRIGGNEGDFEILEEKEEEGKNGGFKE